MKELPPRARRIPGRPLWRGADYGTTSACAENTQKSRFRLRAKWNYLRVRGEYRYRSALGSTPGELPPRARRIPQAVMIGFALEGTTSACAENTLLVDRLHRRCRNYLRVRGEYHRGPKRRHEAWELPPRARRIRDALADFRDVLGTTSACAENTDLHYRILHGF